jgi:hypothetical protein
MSLIDDVLVIHETTLTASAATTDFIDQGAANVAIGNELYLELLVTTTLDSTEEDATLTFSIQGDSSSAFGSATTLVSTAAIAEASLAAGYTMRLRMPIDAGYQYLRGYMTVGTHNFTSGAVKVYMIQTPYERS